MLIKDYFLLLSQKAKIARISESVEEVHILATSSDNETCAKLPIFRISSENILKINNKSQISEQQEQYQTSLKPRIDDEHTDIIKDVKLNSKAYVNISRLSKHTLAKIQNYQEYFLSQMETLLNINNLYLCK